MSRTRLYRLHQSMKSRCNTPTDTSFPFYGARGITVCREWQESFRAFAAWALVNGYDDTLTIDRKNSRRGYSVRNCRWITRSENARRGRKKSTSGRRRSRRNNKG